MSLWTSVMWGVSPFLDMILSASQTPQEGAYNSQLGSNLSLLKGNSFCNYQKSNCYWKKLPVYDFHPYVMSQCIKVTTILDRFYFKSVNQQNLKCGHGNKSLCDDLTCFHLLL